LRELRAIEQQGYHQAGPDPPQQVGDFVHSGQVLANEWRRDCATSDIDDLQCSSGEFYRFPPVLGRVSARLK
jgi:hypothetical protein